MQISLEKLAIPMTSFNLFIPFSNLLCLQSKLSFPCFGDLVLGRFSLQAESASPSSITLFMYVCAYTTLIYLPHMCNAFHILTGKQLHDQVFVK